MKTKIEEAEKLQRDIKFKQEDAKARFERREQALFTPILQDVYKSVREFSKQKGFGLVLDVAKMEQAGIAIGWDDKADVTKEFIAFYNARPAGTAAGAP